MSVTTLVAPLAEPVGLAEAKEYLRIGYDAEDGLVGDLIAAARARIEALAGIALIARTLRVSLDRWPKGTMETRAMRLPVRPAASLVAVRVYDNAGDASDVSDQFTLDVGRSARLVWASGGFPWPGRRNNGVEVDYVAGFGASADDVSDGLRLAVLRMVAHGYVSRDVGLVDGALPEDVAGLVSPWRRVSL